MSGSSRRPARRALLAPLLLSIALSAGCGEVAAAVAGPPGACEPMRNAINAGATRLGELADQATQPQHMTALAVEQERFAASLAGLSTDDAELVAVRDEYISVYTAMAAASRRVASSAAVDEAAIAALEAELEALANREEAVARRFEMRCP